MATISESFPILELSLQEAYYLANNSVQNKLKSADSIIENRKHVDWARTSFASRVRVRGLVQNNTN